MTTAAVIAIGRSTFDVEFGAMHVKSARAVLERLGVSIVGPDDVIIDPAAGIAAVETASRARVDTTIVLQATFTDASTIIALAAAAPTPIVVWSFPEERVGDRLRLNSLCGANLAAYSLRRRQHRCAFVHVDPDALDVDNRVAAAIDAALEDEDNRSTTTAAVDATLDATLDPHVVRAAERIDERLHRSTVGVIGEPPTGFEPCVGDDDQISERLGVRVERARLDGLFDRATTAPTDRVDRTIDRMTTTLSLDSGLTRADLEPSARLYCGMRHLVDGDGLAAVATRCWPECMADFGGAVCTPHAMLTEDRVPGVCEADVLGAVTALVLQLLAGSDPFIADLVDLDEHDDTSVLWHCGVASTRLATPGDVAVGTVHPNRKVALVNQFALRPGRVTVARISQCGGSLHLVLAGGELLDRPRPYTGTCGTIRWDRPVRDVANTIFGWGIAHHLGVVYGDHHALLVELARQWDMPVVHLGATAVAAQLSSNQSG